MLTGNGSGLGVRTGFEAQSFDLVLKFVRTKNYKFARQPA
jgi:hypothetical protein